MSDDSKIKRLLEGQWLHLAALAIFLALLREVSTLQEVRQGSLFGVSSAGWLWLLVTASVAHQIYIWLSWRLELHFGLLTRWFGRWAFDIYAFGFILLIASRPMLITLLAVSNRGSLYIDITTRTVISIVLAIPVAYLFYSVHRYFGMRRAFGIDHFDQAYRKTGLVRKGIFRYTDNAMYTFGLMALWIPGIALGSAAALVAALFSHIYIWVHYFATEKPDMRYIYGKGREGA